MLHRRAGTAPSDLSAGGIRSVDGLQRPPFGWVSRGAATLAGIAAAALNQLLMGGRPSPLHGQWIRFSQSVPTEHGEGARDRQSRERIGSDSEVGR